VELLKVSSRSSPNSVAGALAGVVRQHGAAHIQVIGAGALNQAIKAIAIARGYVAPSGIDLVCVPTFADVEIDGEGRTAIRLMVENRSGTVVDATDHAASPLHLDVTDEHVVDEALDLTTH
jgi:stage V sporulation protein S